jgi:DNA uptake protein ComE-like DNA-binding protein
MNRKVVFAVAVLAATALTAPSAFAQSQNRGGHGGGWGGGWNPPPPPEPEVPEVDPCTDLCNPDLTDISQSLTGFQKAVNLIVDIDDATDVVQSAVNAGNLITFDEGIDIGLGTIIQSADVKQVAINGIAGGTGSTFYNLQQAATNVVNSVTGTSALNINQNATNSQFAANGILGGSGGYDADDIDLEDLGDDVTQTAVNASNLVQLDELNNEIYQTSTNSQTALNAAVFLSEPSYGSYGRGHGGWGHQPRTPDVYDLAQSATNVTNSVTVGEIDLDTCACNFEITQAAAAAQISGNLLVTAGDISNISQSAANVANSISFSVPSAD